MPLPSGSSRNQRFISSRQLLPGDWANAVNDSQSSTQTSNASTTQTQAGGTPITNAIAVVTTANASDTVTLPKGYVGLEIFIANLSANALRVYPAVGDIIFGSIGNAPNAFLAQTASKNAIYKCGSVTAAGVATWYKVESA
jgi:hypothetical protein